MIIKQLSVFLENKTGRLNEVTSLLGEAQINISAFNIADTSEF
ncbi:MAG TPA: amino acid-binding protein, partial [Prolixibacteraceae bacterium]|nr:amino acid-binding protein [Prolixibacteraceae bacterium]